MRCVVVIPTYNERDNVLFLIKQLVALPLDLDLFFVDDASPDGTGTLLDSLRTTYPQLRVMHRPRKLGLGSAYRQSFHSLLHNGYDRFMAMDADLSHPPKFIPTLLRASQEADLVIGSRYVQGGGAKNWSRARHMLSRLANRVSNGMLCLEAHDLTAGFRCYRHELLSSLDRIDIRSNGFAFQIEMTYYTKAMGFRVHEEPILFEERRSAKSKLSCREIGGAMRTLIRLWLHRVSGRQKHLRVRPSQHGVTSELRGKRTES